MSRVFVIGAGFSKAVANAPLATELFEKIYEYSIKETDQYRGQWKIDYSSFYRVVKYLQKEKKPLIDRLLSNETIKIQKSQCDPNLYPDHIEYLCTLIDLNIHCPFKPKGIGSDLQGCPIPNLDGIYVDHLKEARQFIQHYIVKLLLPSNLQANEELLTKAISIIRSEDIVITFNYDILIEQALWERGLWSPLDGYKIGSIVGNEIIDNTVPTKTIVPVIKLHGSVNWLSQSKFLRGLGIGIYTTHLHNNESFFKGLKVKANHSKYEYDYPLNSHVVIPTFMKTFQQSWEIFLVKEASKAISKADEIIILGYSLPDADAMVNFIFADIPTDSKIVIVNPDNPKKLADRLIEKYNLDKNNIIDEASTIEEWIKNDFKYVAYEKEREKMREIKELFGDIPIE